VSIIVSLVIIAAIVFSAFSGSRRGLVLIGLELISFIIATIVALSLYLQLGALLKPLLHIAVALSNIAAFVALWVVVEVACALLIRFAILPHLHHQVQLSLPNRIGGSVLNVLKTTAIITLGLVIFVGLPLTPNTKRPVSEAFVAKQLLDISGNLPLKLAAGLGRDLNDSLSFFTITSDPESQKRIELGFTTTNVSVDARDEAAMLVLLNHERTSRGLPALTLNTQSRTVARAYSTDMFARGYFSHLNNEGKTPFDRMRAADVKFGSAGENLALAPTLQLAHTGLMNSPGHRANILSPNYRTVGIGIVDGGPYGLMVTQEFTD
jgi:uncharacterized protein YkwD